MAVDERAVLEALGNTSGWAVGPVRKGGRREVEFRGDAEEIRLELWFRDDDAGTERVRAILAALGKGARVV